MDFYKQSCFAAGAKFFAAGAKFFAAGGKLVCRGSRGANLFCCGGRTCFTARGELVC